MSTMDPNDPRFTRTLYFPPEVSQKRLSKYNVKTEELLNNPNVWIFFHYDTSEPIRWGALLAKVADPPRRNASHVKVVFPNVRIGRVNLLQVSRYLVFPSFDVARQVFDLFKDEYMKELLELADSASVVLEKSNSFFTDDKDFITTAREYWLFDGNSKVSGYDTYKMAALPASTAPLTKSVLARREWRLGPEKAQLKVNEKNDVVKNSQDGVESVSSGSTATRTNTRIRTAGEKKEIPASKFRKRAADEVDAEIPESKLESFKRAKNHEVSDKAGIQAVATRAMEPVFTKFGREVIPTVIKDGDYVHGLDDLDGETTDEIGSLTDHDDSFRPGVSSLNQTRTSMTDSPEKRKRRKPAKGIMDKTKKTTQPSCSTSHPSVSSKDPATNTENTNPGATVVPHKSNKEASGILSFARPEKEAVGHGNIPGAPSSIVVRRKKKMIQKKPKSGSSGSPIQAAPIDHNTPAASSTNLFTEDATLAPNPKTDKNSSGHDSTTNIETPNPEPADSMPVPVAVPTPTPAVNSSGVGSQQTSPKTAKDPSEDENIAGESGAVGKGPPTPEPAGVQTSIEFETYNFEAAGTERSVRELHYTDDDAKSCVQNSDITLRQLVLGTFSPSSQAGPAFKPQQPASTGDSDLGVITPSVVNLENPSDMQSVQAGSKPNPALDATPSSDKGATANPVTPAASVNSTAVNSSGVGSQIPSPIRAGNPTGGEDSSLERSTTIEDPRNSPYKTSELSSLQNICGQTSVIVDEGRPNEKRTATLQPSPVGPFPNVGQSFCSFSKSLMPCEAIRQPTKRSTVVSCQRPPATSSYGDVTRFTPRPVAIRLSLEKVPTRVSLKASTGTPQIQKHTPRPPPSSSFRHYLQSSCTDATNFSFHPSGYPYTSTPLGSSREKDVQLQASSHRSSISNRKIVLGNSPGKPKDVVLTEEDRTLRNDPVNAMGTPSDTPISAVHCLYAADDLSKKVLDEESRKVSIAPEIQTQEIFIRDPILNLEDGAMTNFENDDPQEGFDSPLGRSFNSSLDSDEQMSAEKPKTPARVEEPVLQKSPIGSFNRSSPGGTKVTQPEPGTSSVTGSSRSRRARSGTSGRRLTFTQNEIGEQGHEGADSGTGQIPKQTKRGGKNKKGPKPNNTASATEAEPPKKRMKTKFIRVRNQKHAPADRPTRDKQEKQPIVDDYFRHADAAVANAPKDIVFPVKVNASGGRAVLNVYSDSNVILKKVIDSSDFIFDMGPSEEQALLYIGYSYLDCVKRHIEQKGFLTFDAYKVKAEESMKRKFLDKWDKPGVMFAKDTHSREEEKRFLDPNFFKTLTPPPPEILKQEGCAYRDPKNFNIDNVKLKHFCGLHSDMDDYPSLNLYKYGYPTYEAFQVHYREEHDIIACSLTHCPVTVETGMCTYQKAKTSDVTNHLKNTHKADNKVILKLKKSWAAALMDEKSADEATHGNDKQNAEAPVNTEEDAFNGDEEQSNAESEDSDHEDNGRAKNRVERIHKMRNRVAVKRKRQENEEKERKQPKRNARVKFSRNTQRRKENEESGGKNSIEDPGKRSEGKSKEVEEAVSNVHSEAIPTASSPADSESESDPNAFPLATVVKVFRSNFQRRFRVPEIFKETEEKPDWPFRDNSLFVSRLIDVLPPGECRDHFLSLEKKPEGNEPSGAQPLRAIQEQVD